MAIDAWSLLKEAGRREPALRYAIGLVGVAAAGALAITLLGSGRNSVLIVGLSLCGMIVFFVATRATKAPFAATRAVAAFLTWAIVVAFVSFIALTFSAFLWGVPCKWAEFIGVSQCPSPTVACAKVLRAEGPLQFGAYPVEISAEDVCRPGLDQNEVAIENLRILQYFLMGVVAPQKAWLFPSVERYAENPNRENRLDLEADLDRVDRALETLKQVVSLYFQSTGDYRSFKEIAELVNGRENLIDEMQEILARRTSEEDQGVDLAIYVSEIDGDAGEIGSEYEEIREWNFRYAELYYPTLEKIEAISAYIESRQKLTLMDKLLELLSTST